MRPRYGVDGLAGLLLGSSTQVVTPAMAAAPAPITMGEFRMPPSAATAAPAARFFFFFSLGCRSLLFTWSVDSCRVVSWPCGRVTEPLASLIKRSPLLAAILTVPSTSVAVHFVQAVDAGATVTSQAVAAPPCEGEPVSPPCAIFKDEPSSCTRESASTVML